MELLGFSLGIPLAFITFEFVLASIFKEGWDMKFKTLLFSVFLGLLVSLSASSNPATGSLVYGKVGKQAVTVVHPKIDPLPMAGPTWSPLMKQFDQKLPLAAKIIRGESWKPAKVRKG